MLRRTLGVVAALLLALAGYLLLWPVPIEPRAWTPPAFTGYTGPHERNDRLRAATQISVAPEVGPEHIAIGPDGKLYTGVLSGLVLRMNPDGSARETVANTGGRPLGLDFDASGRLLVADALRGLLAVEPDGRVTVLADRVGDAPIAYADALAVAQDGRVLLTDASTRFTPQQFGTFDAALLDVLEQSCSGRVLEYDPATSSTRVVAHGLCFPNGVALSADERALIVAETGTYRILRLDRTASDLDVGAALASGSPAVRVLLDNLPGFPDNVTRGADGRYWTGFTKPRSATVDALATRPWLRAVTLRLPRFLWPVPPAYGHVIAFDEQGRVLADLQDPSGTLPETSGATEHDGTLYVQSLHATAFARLPLGQPPRP